MNDDSLRGMKGNSTNCGLIVMDNLGLIPDDSGFYEEGVTRDDFLINLCKQAELQIIFNDGKFGQANLGPTLKDFAERHPEGLFAIICSGHVAAIVNGEIWNGNSDQIVKLAIKVNKHEPKMMGSY